MSQHPAASNDFTYRLPYTRSCPAGYRTHYSILSMRCSIAPQFENSVTAAGVHHVSAMSLTQFKNFCPCTFSIATSLGLSRTVTLPKVKASPELPKVKTNPELHKIKASTELHMVKTTLNYTRAKPALNYTRSYIANPELRMVKASPELHQAKTALIWPKGKASPELHKVKASTELHK